MTFFDELKHFQPNLTQLDTQKHDVCKFWENLYQAFKQRMIDELFEAKESK